MAQMHDVIAALEIIQRRQRTSTGHAVGAALGRLALGQFEVMHHHQSSFDIAEAGRQSPDAHLDAHVPVTAVRFHFALGLIVTRKQQRVWLMLGMRGLAHHAPEFGQPAAQIATQALDAG